MKNEISQSNFFIFFKIGRKLYQFEAQNNQYYYNYIDT